MKHFTALTKLTCKSHTTGRLIPLPEPLPIAPPTSPRAPTFIDERVSIAEVDQRRQRLDAVPLGQLRVLDLDHVDAVEIALVVDGLQLRQCHVASLAVRLVCRAATDGEERLRDD